MKDVFLIYNTCCFYEIVILNYFMSVTNCDVIYCSLDGNPVKTTEGFSVNVDMALENLDKEQIRSFIIPGGDISIIDNVDFRVYLKDLKERDILMAGICAGVDVLEKAEILDEAKSIYSLNEDCVCDKNIITARANAYVDFAIEVAKRLDLFESEEDLQETIDFWKYHVRVQ